MRFKTLSLYADFMDFLHKEAAQLQRHVRIGQLLLTFKLVNTANLSAESKLTYAYLFFHRHDISGIKVRVLSEKLGMTPGQIRNTLQELQGTKHIRLITTQQSADLRELTYYYEITDPTRYGMHTLEKEQCNQEEEASLSVTAR